MDTKGILICVAAVVAAIALLWALVTSFAGNAIAYEEKVTEAKSNISAQERMRADTLPNLADAIKSYNEHEYRTLMDIIKTRRGEDGSYTDSTVNEIKTIISAVAEAYPELKSSENYRHYMNDLMTIESKLYQVRESYNSAVSRYNTYVRHPLHKVFLSLTGYQVNTYEKLTFNVSSEAPSNLFGGS